jgi:uncharacterized DUF497 family protein
MSERARTFGGTQARNWVRGSTGDFLSSYYSDQRSDLPAQHRAIGWVRGRLYSVIFEVREDAEGEFYHLVTLWKATAAERKLYEEHTT